MEYPDDDYYIDYSDEDELAQEEFYVDQWSHSHMEMEEFLEEEEFGGGGLAPFSLMEMLEHCVDPTIRDGIRHMGKIVVWCLVFRIVTQSRAQVNPFLCHLCSLICGSCVLLHFFGAGSLYLACLAGLGYLVLLFAPEGLKGTASASLVVSFNLLTEYWIADKVTWHQVRGAIMVLAMKVISVGFDSDGGQNKKENPVTEDNKEDEEESETKFNRDRGRRKRKSERFENKDKEPEDSSCEALKDVALLPGLLEYLGYCFCPATIILGPWVPLSEYRSIFLDSRWNFTWLCKVLSCSVFSLLFLSLSTCWTPWLLSSPSSPWLEAYREAMSFRASHYFVSFMSEACLIAAGFGVHIAGGKVLWYYTVTEPNKIEVPRSLVEVVVSWQLPMHAWLKRYVFRPTRSRFGPGCGVLATYVASTMLHGLSAQLGLTLLSLGAYTWVEHRLRNKLANSLGASIGSRSVRGTGIMENDENKWWVIVINLLFGLLALFHLTYLGVMFDQSDQQLQQTGYSLEHTLEKWRKLGFASHWVVAGMYAINFLL